MRILRPPAVYINEIKKRSPDTPVSLCQEPLTMWEKLSDVLEMPPDYYACCCAKDSVPGGHPRILRFAKQVL